MPGFILFATCFAVLNACTYIVYERRGRSQWAKRLAWHPSDPGVDPAFREQDMGGQPDPQAPKSVRAIAMWSIGMGQMLIPGAAFACFGTLIYGVGLIGIPGCILAARIWALGPALLRADPRTVEKTEKIADFAKVLNYIVIGASLTLVLVDTELIPFSAGIIGYALVSLAHAAAIRKAGRAVAALWAARAHDPSPYAPGLTPQAGYTRA